MPLGEDAAGPLEGAGRGCTVNICLISEEYPPDTNWGGIATYTRTLARKLVELGHRVHVISRSMTATSNVVEDGGVMVHRVHTRPGGVIAYLFSNRYYQFDPAALFALRVVLEIRRILRTEKIDIIESAEINAYAILAGLRYRNIPLITRLHTPYFLVRTMNGLPMGPRYRINDYLERAQVNLSWAVSSPSKALAGIVQQQWSLRTIDIIPNPFDMGDYIPDPSIYCRYLNGEEYALFFGRLEVLKGPHVLSQAIPRISAALPRLKFVFIGADAPYGETTMRQWIQEDQRGSDKVVFLDNLSRSQLFPVVERAHLVVLPSLWENFAYSCLEAMHLGKAVVATRKCGFEEIVEDGISGILVSPGNSEELAEAVIAALCGGKLDDLGQRARERALKFRSDAIVPKILDYYETVVNGTVTR